MKCTVLKSQINDHIPTFKFKNVSYLVDFIEFQILKMWLGPKTFQHTVVDMNIDRDQLFMGSDCPVKLYINVSFDIL